MKYKFMLLTVIMLYSFKIFSQVGIPTQILSNPTSTKVEIHQVQNWDSVKVSIGVARNIAKDLLRYDDLKLENDLLVKNNGLLVYQNNYRDSIIKINNFQILTYKQIIRDYDEKDKYSIEFIGNLNDKIKKKDKQINRLKTVEGITLYVLAGLTAYTMFHK